MTMTMKPEVVVTPAVDEQLSATLTDLGDRYGPIALALAAADSTDKGALVSQLMHRSTPSQRVAILKAVVNSVQPGDLEGW
jgi:hypothetical protein